MPHRPIDCVFTRASHSTFRPCRSTCRFVFDMSSRSVCIGWPMRPCETSVFESGYESDFSDMEFCSLGIARPTSFCHFTDVILSSLIALSHRSLCSTAAGSWRSRTARSDASSFRSRRSASSPATRWARRPRGPRSSRSHSPACF